MRFYPLGSGSFAPTFNTTASRADYAATASAATLALHALLATSGSKGNIGPDGACNYLDNGPAGISRAGDNNFKGPQGATGTASIALEPTP